MLQRSKDSPVLPFSAAVESKNQNDGVSTCPHSRGDDFLLYKGSYQNLQALRSSPPAGLMVARLLSKEFSDRVCRAVKVVWQDRWQLLGAR